MKIKVKSSKYLKENTPFDAEAIAEFADTIHECKRIDHVLYFGDFETEDAIFLAHEVDVIEE